MSFKQEIEKVSPVGISTFVIQLIASGRDKEIKENFNELFLKCHPMFRRSFMKSIINIEGIEEIVTRNFEFIIDNIADKDVVNFITQFGHVELFRNKIIENFEYILEKCRDDYLIDLIKKFNKEPRNNGAS